MNFLPTTNVSSPFLTWMSISVSVVLVSGILAVIFLFAMLITGKGYQKVLAAIFSLVTIASIIASAFIYDPIHTDLIPQTKTNLVSNLQQKYAIADVDYNEEDYRQLLGNKLDGRGVSAGVIASIAQSQTIIVLTKDNQKALFLLTQDEATSEPTLSDYPYRAGATSVADITLK